MTLGKEKAIITITGIIYIIIVCISIFTTWDFCAGDPLNLAVFFIYQINNTTYCYYNIITTIILVLIGLGIGGYIIFMLYIQRQHVSYDDV